ADAPTEFVVTKTATAPAASNATPTKATPRRASVVATPAGRDRRTTAENPLVSLVISPPPNASQQRHALRPDVYRP
ncbi:MAG: hypothetical protein ACRDRT_11345, partial [Pseudonocardiaceae bacterium]